MADIAELLARKADVEQELADAEADALAELAAAKEAHRADPTNETAQRRLDAITNIQGIRAAVRNGRPFGVGGDAVRVVDGDVVDTTPGSEA